MNATGTATWNTAKVTGERSSKNFHIGAYGFLKVTRVQDCGEAIEARAYGTELLTVHHGALTIRAERNATARYGWTATLSAGVEILEQDALENLIGNPSEKMTRGQMTNFLRESMAQIIAAGGCACQL
jgi:hypothetical protein